LVQGIDGMARSGEKDNVFIVFDPLSKFGKKKKHEAEDAPQMFDLPPDV
jgi:hypothetical protein